MALVFNGSANTIGGLAAGGLPDASVVKADLADDVAGTQGAILQVVKGAQMSETQLSSTSTTLADTGITVTITPSSANSKIWVIASGDTLVQGTGYNAYGRLALLRGTTILHEVMQGFDSENSSFGARLYNPFCMQVVDEPSTTSATTYKVQYGLKYGTNYSATIKYPARDETEHFAAQQITVMEVAA